MARVTLIHWNAGEAEERAERLRALGDGSLEADLHQAIDWYQRAVAVDPDNAEAWLALAGALEQAGVAPEKIDYVNAHGTGTALNDKMESLAIRRVFADEASRPPVSSIKALTGHMMGAAGAAEAVASLLALEKGTIPPTWNWQEPDPECDIDSVPNEPRQAKLRRVLSNSYAFGGNNACLLLTAAS